MTMFTLAQALQWIPGGTLVGDGGTVLAEQLIARIDTEGKGAAVAAPAPAAAAPAPAPAAAAAATTGSKAGVAMPAAAKLMADNNLASGSVPGTGKDGRVTKGDVLGAVAGGAPKSVAASVPVARAAAVSLPQVAAPGRTLELGERPEQRVPMSRLRARVAERLLQSQSSNAILTTFNEVNMAPVMEMRKKFQDAFTKEHGVKIGFMSFFVKAAVHALKKFPVINASVDGNDIVYHGYFDIGIAVGSPRGLVVPILRNADQMSFADIEKKIAEFGQKAKDGKLSLDDPLGKYIRRWRNDARGKITVRDGKYGPYVNWEKVNATLPKGKDPQSVTMEEAIALITERAAKAPSGKKAPAKKKAAASTAKSDDKKAAKPKAAAKPAPKPRAMQVSDLPKACAMVLDARGPSSEMEATYQASGGSMPSSAASAFVAPQAAAGEAFELPAVVPVPAARPSGW